MREFFLNSGIYFEENVPLKKLTTFGTGGPARYVVQPKDCLLYTSDAADE